MYPDGALTPQVFVLYICRSRASMQCNPIHPLYAIYPFLHGITRLGSYPNPSHRLLPHNLHRGQCHHLDSRSYRSVRHRRHCRQTADWIYRNRRVLDTAWLRGLLPPTANARACVYVHGRHACACVPMHA